MTSATSSNGLPQTLAELKKSKEFGEGRIKRRSVKEELRENLIARLRKGEAIFPGIVGFEDTVISSDRERRALQTEFHLARPAGDRPRAESSAPLAEILDETAALYRRLRNP